MSNTNGAKRNPPYPTVRHRFCTEHRCPWCLEDAMSLMNYLNLRIGGNHDELARYRGWLDRVEKFKGAETEWGWFHPDIFKPELIEKYIAFQIGVPDESH